MLRHALAIGSTRVEGHSGLIGRLLGLSPAINDCVCLFGDCEGQWACTG